jgi:thiol-disulfide isomerase/thioredoxin
MQGAVGRSYAALVLMAMAALAGCGGAGSAAPGARAEAQPATAAEPGCDPGPDAAHDGPLSWFHDDYGAALRCARVQGKPLVVDMWAPWCHTCLSMKHTVLIDPGLVPFADRFVWLAIDTDKEANAAVTAKFPPVAWPTFFVVSPDDETIQARHVGAASVRQFREMLGEGERAYLDDKAGTLPEGSPVRLVRDAHRAEARRDWDAADALYGQALTAAPTDWPRRPDVLVSRIGVLYKKGDYQACMALGAAQAQHTGRAASAADFAYYAMACAQASAQQTGDARAIHPLISQLFARLSSVVGDPGTPLSVDDRADALRILREMKVLLGDEPAARSLALRQRAMIDAAMKAAPTPFAAMTFAWPASEVYVYLGVPGELVPVLEKMVADLPEEYDPPHRLGWVLLQMGELDRALSYAERAVALAYGPRKARVQGLLVSIHRARDDGPAQRAALEAVLATWRSLPESQQNAGAIEQAEQQLAELR